MSKFELSLSKDYVADWSIIDGVRELFQNALDQETVNASNKMFFEYSAEKQKLFIGNKESILEARTLLLGVTTKSNDDSTIGQFGEGYKVATLVLLRNNKDVTFYNYGNREIWRPRFVKSRKYGEEILTFFVDKVPVWEKAPDNNLTIVVDNITEDEYADIVKSNLHLQNISDDVKIETPFGTLLKLGEGDIYVNGLYVTNVSGLKYSYDIKPAHLKIGRDRSLVSDFDVQWVTALIMRSIASRNPEFVADAIRENIEDCRYINSITADMQCLDRVADLLMSYLEESYGNEVILVTDEDEAQQARRCGKKSVIVTKVLYETVMGTGRISKIQSFEDESSLYDKVIKWFNEYKTYLPASGQRKFEPLLEEIKNYTE